MSQLYTKASLEQASFGALLSTHVGTCSLDECFSKCQLKPFECTSNFLMWRLFQNVYYTRTQELHIGLLSPTIDDDDNKCLVDVNGKPRLTECSYAAAKRMKLHWLLTQVTTFMCHSQNSFVIIQSHGILNMTVVLNKTIFLQHLFIKRRLHKVVQTTKKKKHK